MDYPIDKNPFSLRFGSVPPKYIEPTEIVNEVIGKMKSEYVTDNCFVLTGVRGSGKTVTLSHILSIVREFEEFVVVRIPSEDNMWEHVIAQINMQVKDIKNILDEISLSLSVPGVNVSTKKTKDNTDNYIKMQAILKEFQRKGKKLLIAYDEAAPSMELKKFGKEFNALSSDSYPIYLIMTGLPENIYDLEHIKDYTFVKRACKKVMPPLNSTRVRSCYENTFGIDFLEAEKLAKLTKYYPTAFELLGQILWNKQSPKITEEVLKMYDEELAVKVYDGIWESIVDKNDKLYLSAIAQKESVTVAEILEYTQKSSSEYRRNLSRLALRGIVNDDVRGIKSFKLPRFAEYVRKKTLLEGLD